MAITNRSSSLITALTSTPRSIPNPPLAGGEARVLAGVVTSAADDSGTSVFRFFRIRSNDCVHSLRYSGADASSAGAIDVGIYQTADNGGAVVDADFFASAFALTNGPDSNTEIAFESGVYTIANSVKPLWQALGLTTDPGIEYDVAATITTTFNGGPTSMKLMALVVG